MIGAIASIIRQVPPANPGTDPTADMADILGQTEFRRDPSWWDNTREWLGDHLSFSWLGTAGQFVAWILLVLTVSAAAAWLWRRWRSRERRARPSDEIVPIELGEARDPDELRATRRAFEAERDYEQAILFRYRELVATLMAHRLVVDRPGRTTGELRRDLAASVPDAEVAFDGASTIFEVTWFSDHVPGAEEFERLDALATATLLASGTPLPSDTGLQSPVGGR